MLSSVIGRRNLRIIDRRQGGADRILEGAGGGRGTRCSRHARNVTAQAFARCRDSRAPVSREQPPPPQGVKARGFYATIRPITSGTAVQSRFSFRGKFFSRAASADAPDVVFITPAKIRNGRRRFVAVRGSTGQLLDVFLGVERPRRRPPRRLAGPPAAVSRWCSLRSSRCRRCGGLVEFLGPAGVSSDRRTKVAGSTPR